MARAMAWFSTPGFHCSSTMKTRLAHVRFRLRHSQYHICLSRGQSRWITYPNAPVPVVIMSTGISSSLANRSRVICRCGGAQPPSIRRWGILASSRCLESRCSVLVQQENMRLFTLAVYRFPEGLGVSAGEGLTSSLSTNPYRRL